MRADTEEGQGVAFEAAFARRPSPQQRDTAAVEYVRADPLQPRRQARQRKVGGCQRHAFDATGKRMVYGSIDLCNVNRIQLMHPVATRSEVGTVPRVRASDVRQRVGQASAWMWSVHSAAGRG